MATDDYRLIKSNGLLILAHRTNGRAYATVYCCVCRLSPVDVCDVMYCG